MGLLERNLNNREEKQLKVNIIRHGKALYRQQETSLEEAQDLNPENIREVEASAEELARQIKPDEEVVIWSSPMGRTLHTAKIVSKTLEKKGIKLREKSSNLVGIKIFKELADIGNFSAELFKPLVDGGEVEFAGKKFTIDKRETNPGNLNYTDYYINEGIKNLPEEVRRKMPSEYLKEIESFENFFDVTRRMMRPLSRIKKLNDKPYRIIIVTHNALTNFIGNIFSGGKNLDLDPGKFINIERRKGKLVVTRFGDKINEENENDLIEKYGQFSQ